MVQQVALMPYSSSHALVSSHLELYWLREFALRCECVFVCFNAWMDWHPIQGGVYSCLVPSISRIGSIMTQPGMKNLLKVSGSSCK